MDIRVKTTKAQEFELAKEKPKIVLPSVFSAFAKVFDETEAHALPPHREWDHTLDMKPDFIPRRLKPYPLSPGETQTLKEFIDDAF